MLFTGGLPETPCGKGSMLEPTTTIRTLLPLVLRTLEVASLLDAPCGDCNWISRTDLSGIDYIGIDIDADHIEIARQKMARHSRRQFRVANILTDDLPTADAILCRDFLQHLTLANAGVVVDKFCHSEARLIIMTSFDNERNEDIDCNGMFRPLNLTAAPFNLPIPMLAVSDGGYGRALGVWAREDIVAPSYEAWVAMRAWSHRRRERLDGLEGLLLYASGAAVLDVGCNRGLIGYEFANHGARLVHGCDISVGGIETARSLFGDVDCESRFEVADLTKGPSALAAFGDTQYDIVLLLGVYHKLARKMSPAALADLMRHLARRTRGRFAWNGFEHEFAEIDAIFVPLDLRCVHRAEPRGQHVAIWQRQ